MTLRMKRTYQRHPMAKDCPVCGGALRLGQLCEACGYSWQAWIKGIGKAAQIQTVTSKVMADPVKTNRKEKESW